MPRLKSIFLLSRPLNLFIVGATMYITRYVVLSDIWHKGSSGHFPLKHDHFALLVIASIMITASGNIINDYFDQKVDRINKPDRVIIGKSVSRRGAILLHQLLNLAAMIMVGRVCFQYNFWLPIIIPLVIITMLWWYSPVIKKKALVGNVLVALCTALVPVFAGIYDIELQSNELKQVLYNTMNLYHYAWLWIIALAGFAFVLTMIREAVKDAQDLPGDQAANYHTLPIVWGIKRMRRYVYIWMAIFALMVMLCMMHVQQATDHALFITLLLFPLSMAAARLKTAQQPSDFGRVSFWVKVLMFGGLLLLLFML